MWRGDWTFNGLSELQDGCHSTTRLNRLIVRAVSAMLFIQFGMTVCHLAAGKNLG
jgi:hypothetical protein